MAYKAHEVNPAYKKKAERLGYLPEVGEKLDFEWKHMLYGGFVWGADDQPGAYWYNLAEGLTLPTQEDIDRICRKFGISSSSRAITKEDIV